MEIAGTLEPAVEAAEAEAATEAAEAEAAIEARSVVWTCFMAAAEEAEEE